MSTQVQRCETVTWDDLPFWETAHGESLQNKLQIWGEAGQLNPTKEKVFHALDLVPFDKVKVMWVGQDPYPDPQYATGVAFSIPKDVKGYPPTLSTIIREYCTDLHYKRPAHGNLEHWCKEGVLLWNMYLTCEPWKSLSQTWEEHIHLTCQIVKSLSEKGNVVFILSGAHARDLVKLVDQERNCVIETSHPSPRGSINSNHPFIGSRVFSRTNELLVQELGVDPIDWYLDEPPTKREESNVVQHRRARLETS